MDVDKNSTNLAQDFPQRFENPKMDVCQITLDYLPKIVFSPKKEANLLKYFLSILFDIKQIYFFDTSKITLL